MEEDMSDLLKIAKESYTVTKIYISFGNRKVELNDIIRGLDAIVTYGSIDDTLDINFDLTFIPEIEIKSYYSDYGYVYYPTQPWGKEQCKYLLSVLNRIPDKMNQDFNLDLDEIKLIVKKIKSEFAEKTKKKEAEEKKKKEEATRKRKLTTFLKLKKEFEGDL